MLLAELVEESGTTDKTALVIVTVAFLIYRFDATMHIACLQNYNFFGILRIS